MDPTKDQTAASKDHNAAGADDERIGALVQKALAGRLPKLLEDALTPHLASLREQLAPPKVEPQGGKGKDTAGDEHTRRIAEIEAKLADSERARENERQGSREKDAFVALRAELGGKVPADAIDTVAKLIFHAEKAVKVGKDGKVTFRHGDEELSLAEGVAAWTKSKTADLFRPAPGYGGTAPKAGQRAPARPAGDGKAPPNETPRAKADRLLRKLADRAGRPIF